MKYIKLFENFDSEYDMEEINYILLSLDNNPKVEYNELNGNLLVYVIKGHYSMDLDIFKEECDIIKNRLDDIGYTLIGDENDILTSDRVVIINKNYLNKYTNREIALNYLDQFKNLKIDDSKDWPSFIDEDGKQIFRIHEGIGTCVILDHIYFLMDLILPQDLSDKKIITSNAIVDKILIDFINDNYGFDVKSISKFY